MVDRDNLKRRIKRRIKISSLNSPGESWSSIALEKELGPMPVGWDTLFAEQIETPAPKFDLLIGTGETSSDRSVPDEAIKPVDLAAEIRADPSRLARLRAARQVNWAALSAEFHAQGLGIAAGINARRNTTSGLVMVDLADSSRRTPLSALDTPTEKWGAGALAKTLGPWPGVSPSSSESPSTTDWTEPVTPPRFFEKTVDRRFDRDATYRAFLDFKAQVVSRNRDLNVERGARMDTMVAGQRRQRDRQHALRRLRRDIVRGVFGWRSLTGRLLNKAGDALFDSRMRMLAGTHRDARSTLSSEFAARRASVPTWAEHLRKAQRDHARHVAEQYRLAKAEADWLLEARRRRDRLKQGDEAAARLTRARTTVDRRLLERYGSRIESMLNRLGLDQKGMIDELMAAAMTPSERSRLPMLIEGLRERRRRNEQLWLEQVRARRDRLRGSDHVRNRLDRARERRDRHAGQAALATMMSRRAILRQDISPPGKGMWAAIAMEGSLRQGSPTHLNPPEPAVAPTTDLRRETKSPDVEHVISPAAARSDEPARPPDQHQANAAGTPETDRKSLVVQIAMVLIARRVWSMKRGDALGKLVGAKGADLWKAGHVLSQTKHAKRHPANIPSADVQRVWSETRQKARTVGFTDLLRVVDSFGREKEERSRD